MKICNYGISLNLLGKEDIAFINQKLNPIESESTEDIPERLPNEFTNDWFENINYNSETYYLIEYQGNKIGLLSNKNMDWNSRTCETEIYFWKENLVENFIVLISWLNMLEFLFFYLEWNMVFTPVTSNNKASVVQLENLGFALTLQRNSNELQYYSVSRELFDINSKKIIEKAQGNIELESGEGFLLLEPLDYELGIAQKIENHFIETGIYLHRRGISGSRKYFR